MVTGVLDHAFPGVLSSILLVRNYLPLKFPLRDWYTAHFWSLAVEEHFYLLLPGFLVVCRKRRAPVLLGTAAILFCWQIICRRHPHLQFGWAPEDHTDIAVNGILLASAFAVLLKQPQVRAWCDRWLNPYATITVTAMLLGAQQHADRIAFILLLLCIYPVMLISTMLHPYSWPGRVLSWKPLQMLGAVSYSVYLWQMLFFTGAPFKPAAHSSMLALVQGSTPLRYLAVLLASVASYYLVERPLVRVGHRLTLRRAASSEPVGKPTPASRMEVA